MPVLTNVSTLATCRQGGGQGEAHAISDAALAWSDDTITWVGKAGELPNEYRGDEPIDAGGRLVVPGLVDCHTHLIFGGWREDEFELRCLGRSYQDIAEAGGGILSTVRATRETDDEVMLDRAEVFLRRMMRLGVTTVECKSGYGLSAEQELRLLHLYRRLQDRVPIELVPTLLAAHTTPPDRDRGRYVEIVCREIIPQTAEAGLAEFCDVFVEEGAFTIDEARRVLEAGLDYGLRPKLHADQLSDSGAAALAAEVGAASADHLEYASNEGITAMADRGVVAVNLPIATLYLRQKPMNARAFIEAGASVAVATDFNPGSAPSYHLPLAMTLACIQSGMTPAEALKGATLAAAAAIARDDRIGSIEPGKRADFLLVDAGSVNEWLYHFQPNAVVDVYAGGRRIRIEQAPSNPDLT